MKKIDTFIENNNQNHVQTQDNNQNQIDAVVECEHENQNLSDLNKTSIAS